MAGAHREQGRQRLRYLLWPTSGSHAAALLSGSRGPEERVGLEISLGLFLENTMCHRARTRSWATPFLAPEQLMGPKNNEKTAT